MLSVIEKASVSVIFVTPYLDLWNHLQTKIDKTLARGVDVKFVIRTDTAAKNRKAVDWLINRKVKVYEIDWLHAKIYLNEKTVLISSMNITRSSTSNARDFVMIVRNEVDEDKIRTYVLELIRTAKPLPIENKTPTRPPIQKPINYTKKRIVENEVDKDAVKKMENVNADFFKEWREKYQWPINLNREDSEKKIIRLEQLIKENVFKTGSRTPKEVFIEVIDWKTAGKRGTVERFEKNDNGKVEKSIEEVLSLLETNPDDVSRGIRHLSELKGVAIAVASTFLRFLDPTNHRYGIIDTNVARLLNDARITQFKLRMEDDYIIKTGGNFEEYNKYHSWLQKKANELQTSTYTDIDGNKQVFTPVDVEMALFTYKISK